MESSDSQPMDVNESCSQKCSIEDIDNKLGLLTADAQNSEFVSETKHIIKQLSSFDLSTTNDKIFAKLFALIEHKFVKIFADNCCLFARTEDEFLIALIKVNLETIFNLIEIVQEALNYIYKHSPVTLPQIQSMVKYLPKYVTLYADHCNNSLEDYKTVFIEEHSKIIQVTKHLYNSFLYLLETSLNIQDGDIHLLIDALIALCQMPNILHKIDDSAPITCWKSFNTVTNKYSSLLESNLDVRIPIDSLSTDLCEILLHLDKDEDIIPRQTKTLTFLLKILTNITHMFYQNLNVFAANLLTLFIKVFRYFPQHNLKTNGFYGDLKDFLGHLIIGQQLLKDNLADLKGAGLFEQYPVGVLILLNHILRVINQDVSDWSGSVEELLQHIFELIPSCNQIAIGNLYQDLLLNVAATILIHDAYFCSAHLLLKYALQDNVFVSLLAIDVYSLVISNIPAEEALSLFINLLYGAKDLNCGFLTPLPQLVQLKCLLQRLFTVLPDVHKEHVIKLFPPHIQIQTWRFLGFSNIGSPSKESLLEPIVANTLKYIRSVDKGADMPGNIAEGLELVATVNNRELTAFLYLFWSSIDQNITNNNIFKYFVTKITFITANSILNGTLHAEQVFTRLAQTLHNNKTYWISTFAIISYILLKSNHNQDLLKTVAKLLPNAMKCSPLMKEMYLELLKNLNQSDNESVNILLDSLDPLTAHGIFDYLEQLRRFEQVVVSNVDTTSSFSHSCVQWSSAHRPIKRLKVDNSAAAVLPRPTRKPAILAPRDEENEEDSATEVIERIKGEVKCLLRISKTDKLTSKNINHLKVIVSQISSLM